MSSIAAALFGLGLAVANLLASVVVSIIDDITSRGGKEGWVSSNINKGRIDNYYWVLTILSVINLLYYFVCAWAYGPCGDQPTKVTRARNGLRKEELANLGTKGMKGKA
ncbi:hypothetical protein GOBAR_DD34192 [Gossypium barbadense]|nr:hypothetical protein GOBAR_DD34192 [Gossypium barbadense]